MSEKRVLSIVLHSFIILTCFLFLISFAAAANETGNTSSASTANLAGFEKADSCLKAQIDAKTYKDMNTEELAFSMLALGYDSDRRAKLKEALDNLGANGECWPKAGCTVKDTAQVLFAYSHINQDTAKIKKWLLEQTAASTDLVWFLQIETTNASSCTLRYDNSTRTITLLESRKISGNPGNCFSISSNGYWLQVSNKCYGKDFDISCTNDFMTTTFYKKTNEDIYYLSGITQTRLAPGTLTEKIESLCFKQGTACNYEASLWAAAALQKTGAGIEEINKFLPYLITLAGNNQRYFPSAFLYLLTSYDEYFNTLTSKQNIQGYWRVSETPRTYYDTATALMALYRTSESEQITKAKEYLITPGVQGANGCWNGITDTAYLLYAVLQKPASGGVTPRSQCNDYSDYSCTSSAECRRLNGTELPNFNCYSGFTCCSKKAIQQTCSEKDGVKCSSGQDCSGGEMVSAGDTGLCCIDGGVCKDRQEIVDTCTPNDYTCKASCLTTEETKDYQCEEGVCCGPVVSPPTTSSNWWIWLLVILIILVALAIVFRKQLVVWWFKMKSKFQKGPASAPSRSGFPPFGGTPSRPGMPGMIGRMVPGAAPRPPMRPPAGRPMPGRPFAKDKELDETLRKLKDMGK